MAGNSRHEGHARRFSAAALVFLLVSVSTGHASDLLAFPDSTYVENPYNDGDSFSVNAGGKLLHVRLYFVDCPETSGEARSDALRVREQTRYFGLKDPSRTVHYGKTASAFVRKLLKKEPFVLHTSFARAMGRSSVGRVYGLVTTRDGKDLATLLVKNGLARAYGFGRRTPEGVDRDETARALRDFEDAAKLKNAGIWSESDPESISDLRALQRGEDTELSEIQEMDRASAGPKDKIDINRAGRNELESIKGIGPALSGRIVAGRPYKTVDQLLEVKGIGPKTLEKIKPFVKTSN